jgi:hypothetical protein
MTIKQMISEMRKEIRWAAYGALFFWLPDILVHAIAQNSFDTVQVWIVTAACPLALVAGYFVIAHFSTRKVSSMHSGLMILGVWCAGGIAIMIASSFAGGAFARADGWLVAMAISFLAVIFPPFTGMLATYDGSFLALLAGTVLMGIEAGTLSARMMKPKLNKAAG